MKIKKGNTDWKSFSSKIDRIEGYLIPGQEKALYMLASGLGPNSTIVEIGSFMGKSTVCLGKGSPPKTKIYSIDTFEGNGTDFVSGDAYFGKNYFRKFKSNLKKFGVNKKVIPVVGFSQKIGKDWNKNIDLLFIDGSHIYKDVKSDFKLFFPWLKAGGIIAFHDVIPEFPGVYRLWNESVKQRLSAHGNTYSLHFGYKPKNILSHVVDQIKIRLLLSKINEG